MRLLVLLVLPLACMGLTVGIAYPFLPQVLLDLPYLSQALLLHLDSPVHILDHEVRLGQWHVNDSLVVSYGSLAAYFTRLRANASTKDLSVSALLLGDECGDREHYRLARHVYRVHACEGEWEGEWQGQGWQRWQQEASRTGYWLLPMGFGVQPSPRWWRARVDGRKQAAFAFVGHASREANGLLKAGGWTGWRGVGQGRAVEMGEGVVGDVLMGPRRLPPPSSPYAALEQSPGGGLGEEAYARRLQGASGVIAPLGHKACSRRHGEALAAGSVPVGRKCKGLVGRLVEERGLVVHKPRREMAPLLARLHANATLPREAALAYIQLLHDTRHMLAAHLT